MLHRLLNALILLPDRYCYQVPTDLGLNAEAVAFPNARGQQLRGFWFEPGGQPGPAEMPQGRAASGGSGTGRPKPCADTVAPEAPVVLFCPGTSGNLSSHFYYIELLCRAGCTVLGFDYSGFGQSAGPASLQTLVTDVLCASDFLRQAKHIEHFGVFGMSLGANIALQVASQRHEIRAVAVEGLALYSDITRGVLTDGIMGPRSVTTIAYDGRPPAPRQHHVLNTWRVPGWLARGLAQAGTALFPFAAKDPRVPARLLTDTPVFCIHGLDDPLLPFEATLQVYDTLAGSKQLWLMPEVSHAQEPVLAQDGEYVAQLADFFHAALQGHRRPALPPITCQLVPQGPERYALRLRNAGPPCMVLTTVVAEQSLASRTIWVQDGTELRVVATGPQPTVHCLSLFEVAGDGDRACLRSTRRGQQYRATFQPHIRALSKALHERRLHDLEPLLDMLPSERPEPPFDFFLGVYCVQIMQRTRYKMPHLAQAAARAFTHYWHYGPYPGQPGQPTLWALATEILGQQRKPRRRVHAGR